MVISRTATFLFFLFALTAQAQTYISGGDVAGTWKTDGNPYVVTNTITINTDDRLKIEPGVIVQFDANCAILVYGNLEAYGTENDSILFTSTDTTGFATNNYSGWFGLAFLGEGTFQNQPSTLEYCIVEYSQGSGISCMQYDNLEISHSHFRNNMNYGISLMEYSDINMENFKVSHNHAGGIDIQYSAPQINHFEVYHNEGTGISISGTTLFNAPLVMSDGNIHHNSSLNNGGAMAITLEANVMMNEMLIHDNNALNGGGIYCAFSSLEASLMTISENTAENGAGIFAAYDAQIQTDHILLINNNASQSGGAVYVTDAEFDLLSSTISNNTAAISGGGFFFDLINNKPNYLSNCIVWQNFPDAIMYTANIPELDFCDVQGGFSGAFNIDADPLFVDSEKGNYQLSWDGYPFENGSKSPCIDAGNIHFEFDPDGTVSDMGAFYFNQSATFTGIESNTNKTSFELYPNPVTSSFSIRGIQDVELIKICNLSGQTLKVFQNVSAQSSFDVSDLTSGIYVVCINRSNGTIETSKMIRR